MNAKSRLGWLVAVLSAVCSLAMQHQGLGQDGALEAFKAIYGFDGWGGQTEFKYTRPVTNWVPDFASLGVTNFLRREEGLWTNSQKYSRYSFLLQPSGSTEARIECAIDERQDVTNAHLAMLQSFSNAQTPQPFPLGVPLGVHVGDRCYLGWGVVDSVFFVRNNVFVFLTGGCSVLELAEKLDSQLVAQGFPGPVLLDSGISGTTFHVSVPTAVSNTYVLEYKDSLSGTNWFAWPPFAGDGTIRLVTCPAWSPQQFFRLRVE